jgi:hypothetical protein
MPAPLAAAGLVAAIVAMQDTDVFRSASEAAKVRRGRTLSHRESHRIQMFQTIRHVTFVMDYRFDCWRCILCSHGERSRAVQGKSPG